MRKILLSLTLIVFVISACKMNLPDEAFIPKEPETIHDIIVPDDFEFKIDRKVKITILTLDTIGLPRTGIPIWVYTKAPEDGGVLLSKGESNEEARFSMDLELEPGQDTLKAYTTEPSLTYSQNIIVHNDDFEFSWGSDDTTIPNEDLQNLLLSAQGGGTDNCPIKFYQVIGKTLKALNVVDGTYTTIGNASANYNGIGLDLNNGKIYGIWKNGNANHLWFIDKKTGAETDYGAIPGLTGNGYNYRSDFDLDGNLTIINQVNGTWNLIQVDVDASPLTTNFIPLTLVNGNIAQVHDLAYNHIFDKFYSIDQNGKFLEIDPVAKTLKILGDYRSTAGNGPFGAVWSDINGYVYISQNNTGDIFLVEMFGNGTVKTFQYIFTGVSTNNNDGASCPLADPPFDLITDTDDDGVPDLIDDAPDDPSNGPNNQGFTPSLGNTGTYAFEDLWPKIGDYDFNDLVLDYNYVYNKNGSGAVTSIDCNYIIRGVGASQQIGFGVSFDNLNPGDVSSINGTQTSSINTSPNGVESGQSRAVVIMFDDAHQLIGTARGKIVNTEIGGVTKSAASIQVSVTLSSPKTQEEIGTLNPFIFTGGDRSHEIHLMNFPPTSLANSSLFGDNNDASNPSQGIFYRDAFGFPWGMNFPSSFSYPKERVNIQQAFPKFAIWVTTSGGSNRDWYTPVNAVSGRIYE